MPSRKHKNTFNLPNKKPRHKNRRSSAPCVKEDEEHCTSGCHPMPIMYSFFERFIKIPLNIPLKITWWIYGTLKYLLLWPLQSTPKSDDDSLLGNPQEQEMLQLKNDIIYNRETYQQEKRIQENEINDYQCQLSEASSKIGALEMSRNDALSRLSEAMSKIDALDISRNDALSRLSEASSEIGALEMSKSDALSRLSEAMSKIDALEISMNDALSRLERANREMNDLRKSKDDALSRLSAMMGAKLRDNNPAITDLNDPNRPMKIGEQFSGIYENEWTDAFIDLEDMKSDVNDGACINEEKAIAILLNILRELNEKSILESDHQLSILLQSVQGHSQDMSSEVTKSTKDTHKANAVKYIPVLCKKITCEDSQCKTVLKYTSHCQSYIEKCLKVCYFAAVQDPPMYLDFEPGEDSFDRQAYKEYTQMGTKVKFLVWPALFLHKGGALISKGVLQPILDTN